MRKTCSLLLLSLMLSACGGGSSEEATPAPSDNDTPPATVSVAIMNNIINVSEGASASLGYTVDSNKDNVSLSVSRKSGSGFIDARIVDDVIVFSVFSISADTTTQFLLRASVDGVTDEKEITINAKNLPDDRFTMSISQGSVDIEAGSRLSIPFTANYEGNEDIRYTLTQAGSQKVRAYLADESASTSQSVNVTNQSVSSSSNNGNIEVFAEQGAQGEINEFVLTAHVGDEVFTQNITVNGQDSASGVSVSVAQRDVSFSEQEQVFVPINVTGADGFSVEKITGNEFITATKQAGGILFSSLPTQSDVKASFSVSATNGDVTQYADIAVLVTTTSPESLIVDLSERPVNLASNSTYRLPVDIDYNKEDDVTVTVTKLNGGDVVTAQYVNQALSISTSSANDADIAVFDVVVSAGSVSVSSEVTVNYAAPKGDLVIAASQDIVELEEGDLLYLPYSVTDEKASVWVDVDNGSVNAYIGNGVIIIEGLSVDVDTASVLTISAQQGDVIVTDTVAVRVIENTPYKIDINLSTSALVINENGNGVVSFSYSQNENRVVDVSVVNIDEQVSLNKSVSGNNIIISAGDVSSDAFNQYELVLSSGDYIIKKPFSVSVNHFEPIVLSLSLSSNTLGFISGETSSISMGVETNSQQDVTYDIVRAGNENVVAIIDGDVLTVADNADNEEKSAVFNITATAEGVSDTQTLSVNVAQRVFSLGVSVNDVAMSENSNSSAPISIDYNGNDAVEINIVSVSNNALAATVNNQNIMLSAGEFSQNSDVSVTLDVKAGSVIQRETFTVFVNDVFVPSLNIIPASTEIAFEELSEKVVPFELVTNLPVNEVTLSIEKVDLSGLVEAELIGNTIVFTSPDIDTDKTARFRLTATHPDIEVFTDVYATAKKRQNTLKIEAGDGAVSVNEKSEIRLPINVSYNGFRAVLLSATTNSDFVQVDVIDNDTLRIKSNEVDVDQSVVVTLIGRNDEDSLSIDIPVKVREVFESSVSLNLLSNEVIFTEGDTGVLKFVTDTNVVDGIVTVTSGRLSGETGVAATVVGDEIRFTIGDISRDISATFTAKASIEGAQEIKQFTVTAKKRIYSLSASADSNQITFIEGNIGRAQLVVDYDGDDLPLVVVDTQNALVTANHNSGEIAFVVNDISEDISGVALIKVSTVENEYLLSLPYKVFFERVIAVGVVDSLSLESGESATLPVGVDFNGTEDVVLTVTSSNPNIVSASIVNGQVFLSAASSDDAKEGIVTVTATSEGVTDSKNIKVSVNSAPKLSLSLAENSVTFNEQINASVSFIAEHNHGQSVLVSAHVISGDGTLQASISGNDVVLTSDNIQNNTQSIVEIRAQSGGLEKTALLTINVLRVDGQLDFNLSSSDVRFSETGSSKIDLLGSYSQSNDIGYSVQRVSGSFSILTDIVADQLVFTSSNVESEQSAVFEVTATVDGQSLSRTVTATSEAVSGETSISLSQNAISFNEQDTKNVTVSASNTQGAPIVLSVSKLSGDDTISATVSGDNIIFTSGDILSENDITTFRVMAEANGVSATADIQVTALVKLGNISIDLSQQSVNMDESSAYALGFTVTHSLNKATTVDVNQVSGSSSVTASVSGNMVNITSSDVSADVSSVFELTVNDGEIDTSRTFTVNVEDKTVYIALSTTEAAFTMQEDSVVTIPLSIILTNEQGGESIAFETSFNGSGSTGLTASVTDGVLSVTANDLQRDVVLQLTVIAFIGDESDSVILNLTTENTSMQLLESRYAPFISGNAYNVEAGAALASLYANTAVLSGGFDDAQAQSMIAQHELDVIAVSGAVDNSTAITFNQSVIDYANGLVDESVVVDAFDAHRAEVAYLQQTVLVTINSAANVSNGLLPALDVGEFTQSTTGDYSLFIGNSNMGVMSGDVYSLHASYTFLERHIAIGGTIKPCAISQ